jgi:methylmalonyl-CoA mutase
LNTFRTGLATGMKIDEFAPRLSFFGRLGWITSWKLPKCVGRMIWAKLVKQFEPKTINH